MAKKYVNLFYIFANTYIFLIYIVQIKRVHGRENESYLFGWDRLVLILILSSCAAGPNKLEKTPNEEGKTAGLFFSGGILGRGSCKKKK
jgi:hypothetical protein